MTPRTLRLSDGAAVRVLAAGVGAPLLLIHGVGLRAEAWGPQIAALSRTHHVLAVDMPGHGQSDELRAPNGPTLTDYVGWAAQVVTALNLGTVSLAGHSMGALITLGLAVDHPQMVARAALLNGVFQRSPQARADVLARANDIAAGAVNINAPLTRWFTADQDALRAQVAGWLAAVSPQGYAAAYRAFASGDATYSTRIPHITCPLLAITGADDANSTPEMTRAIAGLAPNGRALVVAGHRHMVNLTAPETVSQAMAEWLCTQKAPSA